MKRGALARLLLLSTASTLVVSALALAADGAPLPLQTVARVPLPGPSVRFDYQSIDPSTNRLFIAHMNADEVLAVDLRTRKVVKRIPAPGVHGVLAVPGLGRVFATATDDHEVLTIDARSGRITAHAPAGDYPDGLAYDPVERRVFVSDEGGGSEIVLGARGHPVTKIPLGGSAGNTQYDPGSKRVLVDVQSRNELAVIDPRTNRVVRRVALAGCDSNHGLSVDSPRRLAFVGCAGNAKLLTLDLRSMRVTGSADVGDDPDVLAFDGSLRRLYVASESGEVAVFAEKGRRLERLGLAGLDESAHTVAVDPRTHLVYFPLERGAGGKPELLIMKPR
jgi:DNA-binding beta-propeller fold protein YncE